MPKSSNKTLERAIRRAIRNGWTPNGMPLKQVTVHWPDESDFPNDIDLIYIIDDEQGIDAGFLSHDQILFNHDFAKALWGEVPNSGYLKAANKIPWKYHLQQMVIADDPIKYLGENI